MPIPSARGRAIAARAPLWRRQLGFGTSRTITLTAALPAGATLAARTTLSISTSFTLNATVSLPSGYTATGQKATASVSSTLVLCSAN